jgi:hypothetical protein
VDAAKAGSKILAICEKCGKRMGIDASYAGRSVKCGCGNVFKASGTPVPAAVPVAKPVTASAAKATQPALVQTATAPKGTAKPLAAQPSVQTNSFLDQLTTADFSRPSTNPYDPPASQSNNEAAILRKYVGVDEKAEEFSKTAKGNIVFLAVMNFIGAVGNAIVGGMVLLLSGLLATLADVMPIAAFGVLLAGVLFVFAVYDLVAGIGLLQRQPWALWLSVVGLSWSLFDRTFGLILQFMHATDWLEQLLPALGVVFFAMSNFYFLHFMCQPQIIKMFKVKSKPALLWTVGLSTGLVLAGSAFAAILAFAPGKA